jgi:hypothetical protein
MRQLLEELRVEIPKAFEGNVYEQQKDAIVSQLQNAMEQLFNTVEGEARKSGIHRKKRTARLVLVPLKQDGTPMPQDEFEKLDPQLKKQYEEQGHQLEKRLDETLHEGQQLQKITNEKILQLEKDITMQAAAEPFGTRKRNTRHTHRFRLISMRHSMTCRKIIPCFVRMIHSKNKTRSLSCRKTKTISYDTKSICLSATKKTEGAPVIIESNPYYIINIRKDRI